ncbi:MAG: hypothetical protein WCT01_05140 [Candidatus Shapirobacteria bacterium]
MSIKEAVGDALVCICRPKAALKADFVGVALAQGDRVEVGGVDMSKVLSGLTFGRRVRLLTWLGEPVRRPPVTETYTG